MLKRLLCASLICAGIGTAQAGDPGFYVGGGIGQSRYDDNLTGQIRSAYANYPDYSFVSGRLTDDSDQAWKLFGGYRFLPWLGVEFGWVSQSDCSGGDVTDSKVRGSGSGDDADAGVGQDAGSRGEAGSDEVASTIGDGHQGVLFDGWECSGCDVGSPTVGVSG